MKDLVKIDEDLWVDKDNILAVKKSLSGYKAIVYFKSLVDGKYMHSVELRGGETLDAFVRKINS